MPVAVGFLRLPGGGLGGGFGHVDGFGRGGHGAVTLQGEARHEKVKVGVVGGVVKVAGGGGGGGAAEVEEEGVDAVAPGLAAELGVDGFRHCRFSLIDGGVLSVKDSFAKFARLLSVRDIFAKMASC